MFRLRPYTLSLIFLLLGIAVSIAIFFSLRHYEMELAQKEFSKVLDKYTISIEHTLHENTHTLKALAAFHYGSPNITKEQFGNFARMILGHHSELRALEWIPEISDHERQAFEEAIRAKSVPDFTITQLGASGEMVRADEWEVYYPVTYVEPMEGNEKAFGFDLGSEPKRLTALQMAKRIKDIVMTAPIRLVQDEERQQAVLIYFPIYGDPVRWENFQGVFLSVLRIKELISAAIAKVAPRCEGVELTITDAGADESNKILFHQPCISGTEAVDEVRYERTITFAGRQWHIAGNATEMFVSRFTTYYPWVILSVLLLLSLLVAVLYYVLARRHALLQETNEELRRFQKVAIGREERIAELKRELEELKSEKGLNDYEK